MKSNQNRPIWPYLGVLVCLFVLSLTAPRTWREVSSIPVAPSSEPETQPEISTSPAITRDVGEPSHEETSLTQVEDSPAPAESVATAELPKDASEIDAAETVALPSLTPFEEISQEESNGGNIATDVKGPLLAPEPQLPTLAQPLPQRALVRVSNPDDRLAMLPVHPPTVPTMQLPQRQEEAPSQAIVQAPEAKGLPEWTVPERLIVELRELASHEPTSGWATSTLSLIHYLTDANQENPLDTKSLFTDLHRATNEARKLASSVHPDELRTKLLRVRYAVARRLVVWETIDQHRDAFEAEPYDAGLAKSGVSRSLAEVAALTGNNATGKAWRDYLLLDSLRGMLDREEEPTELQRRATVRRVLGQINAAQQSRPQSRFVQGGPMVAFGKALRQWSEIPVDPRTLLSNLERYETTGQGSDAQHVAVDYQRLAFSPREEQQALGMHLEQHYRNANLRIALSAAMLDRWLPEPKPVQGRVSDRILDADVEGESYTTTTLGVRLIPDRTRLRLGLEARGIVHSETEATNGPATFHSTGQTQYLAHKVITFDRRGVRISPAVSNADSDSDLRGVSTSFDNVPLLSSVFRSYATSQHEKSHGEAMSEVEYRVASKVRQRLDTIANREIRKASEKFKREVLAPLKHLSLDPEILETVTTDQRLIMRVRLADQHQLGAHTPRPRAPSDSQMSMQLHESALNNAIGQLQLDGKTLTLPELYEHLSERLGRQIEPPEDVSDNAQITFAEQDAFHVRCDQGRVEVSIRVAKLSQGKNSFQNFQVNVFYRPERQGLQTQLVRDGSIRLQGKRMPIRSQIVLRGVFSKIFSRNRPVDLIDAQRAADPRLQGLAVTQLVIDDGWLAVALGPYRTRAKASRPLPLRYRR